MTSYTFASQAQPDFFLGWQKSLEADRMLLIWTCPSRPVYPDPRKMVDRGATPATFATLEKNRGSLTSYSAY